MMSEAIEGRRDGTSEANRIENRESDRRRHFRFPFTASVEAIEPLSQARLKGRVSDLGFGGCYVDTMNPFAVGTLIKISLTKEKATFETDAKVIFSHVGMGMGVEFASTLPQQLRVLHNWLTELAGKTSPEQEPMKGTEADGVANTLENQDFVVDELVIALIRKGVLSDVEGNELLQKLYR